MVRKCAVLLVLAAAPGGAADLPAYYDLQPPAAERYAGAEVVRGGGWLPLAAREFPGTVHVLDGEALRAHGYLYLGQALAEEASIYVEFVPGREGPTMVPRLRGATDRELLLLVDGVPANDLATGWDDVKRIPLEAVDRVEILAGPCSWRWGDRAVAGVVNVTTMKRPREAARALVSAADGSADSERYRFNFGMTTHGLDLFTSGNRIISVEPNTRNHEYSKNSSSNVDGRVAYRWGEVGELDLAAGHFSSYEGVLMPWTWDTAAWTPGLQKDWQDRVRLYGRRRVGAGDGRATLYYAGTRSWYNGAGLSPLYQTEAREVAGLLSYTWPHLGADALTVEMGGGRRGNADLGAYAGFVSARVLEEMRVPKAPIYLAVGASYDAIPPDANAISPRLAVSAYPTPWFKAYGAASGGARLPAAGELGRTDAVLREQGYEAGARFYRRGRVEAGLAYFYSYGRDVYLDAEKDWTPELRRRGVELSGEGKLPLWFDWAGSYSLTDATLANGDAAAYVPKHRAFGKVGYEGHFLGDDLSIRYEQRLEYTGARRRVWPTSDVMAADVSPFLRIPFRYELPPYWQLGAHFAIAVVSFEAYVNMENINRARDYVIRPGYAVPRRVRTFVGFNWTLFD